MANHLTAAGYPITETGVHFHTNHAADQQVFDRCEALCKENIAGGNGGCGRHFRTA